LVYDLEGQLIVADRIRGTRVDVVIRTEVLVIRQSTSSSGGPESIQHFHATLRWRAGANSSLKCGFRRLETYG
jgi:hypothetical protein